LLSGTVVIVIESEISKGRSVTRCPGLGYMIAINNLTATATIL